MYVYKSWLLGIVYRDINTVLWLFHDKMFGLDSSSDPDFKIDHSAH